MHRCRQLFQSIKVGILGSKNSARSPNVYFYICVLRTENGEGVPTLQASLAIKKVYAFIFET